MAKTKRAAKRQTRENEKKPGGRKTYGHLRPAAYNRNVCFSPVSRAMYEAAQASRQAKADDDAAYLARDSLEESSSDDDEYRIGVVGMESFVYSSASSVTSDDDSSTDEESDRETEAASADSPAPKDYETIESRAGGSSGSAQVKEIQATGEDGGDPLGLEGESTEVPWSPEEDDVLVATVAKAKAGNWSLFWQTVYNAFCQATGPDFRQVNAVKQRYHKALVRQEKVTPV